MLVEFTVGNFRSTAEKVTLSMIAAPIKSGSHASRLDVENVIRVDDELSLLKTAAIYGANASGKSNILNALTTMGSFMEGSVHTAKKGRLPFVPFLLGGACKENASHFEIIFLMDGLQYRYGFEASASRVEREWLYFNQTARESTLFEREGEVIKIGRNFKGAKGLEPRVATRALFLTVARDFNVPIANNIFQWVNRFVAMSGLDDSAIMYTIECLEDESQKTDVLNFITSLDVGISDVVVSLMPTLKEEESEGSAVSAKSYKVETIHRTYDAQGHPNGNVKFNMSIHESEGTRKLFAMSALIVRTLKHGHILAIDEMDARLHPALTRKIVELFHSKETNPNNAQLIFATQDTNLLDNQLFRRDQIWFAEKNRVGATTLYSLAELKIRNDASYEKDYIEGRYGAIPFPGGFERLFSQSEAEYASK